MLYFNIVFIILIFVTLYCIIQYIRTKQIHLFLLLALCLIFIFSMFPGYKVKGKIGGMEWSQESPPNLFSFLTKKSETNVKIKNTSSKNQENILTLVSDSPLINLDFSKNTTLISGGKGNNIAIYKVTTKPGEIITGQAVTADSVTMASGPTVKATLSPWNYSFQQE